VVNGRIELKRSSLVFGATILCTIAVWLPTARAQTGVTLLEIELDAFSGQPNPRWELAEAQATEFIKQLHALPRTQPSGPGSEGLGYRGFVVTPRSEPMVGFDEIRLYGGTVWVRHGDRTETFRDAGHMLERWLLDSGRNQVPEPVRQHIQREIGP
jgi:hypothetical protein